MKAFFPSFLVLFALLLPSSSSHAADTVVTYTITNGGVDAGNKSWFGVYPLGERNSYLGYAHSKDSVTVPAGTYDIGIHFEDGSAKKVIWETGVRLSDKFEKTVEMNFPLATVTYLINNGGVDTGSKAWFGIYPVGERNSYLGYAHSKESVTVPAGTYDIGIYFEDGSAKKVIWIEKQEVAGKVERTTDIGMGVAKVTYTVTNGGGDTGAKTWFGVYPVGERNSYLGYAHSKESVTVPAGTYDIGIHFEDGSAKKDVWQTNVKIEGSVVQTVELGTPLSQVKFTITNGGVDTGNKSWFGVYAGGDREGSNYIGYAHSHDAVTVPEGTYDVGIHFQDGNVTIKKWIPGVVAKGKVEQTVEIGATMADLVVHVTRRGQPLNAAWCGIFPEGEKGDYSAWAPSDHVMRTLEGTYDVGCFHSEGGLSASKWIKQQALKGKVELSMEIDLTPASLTVTGVAITAVATSATTATNIREANIEIILDASGSMVAKVDNKTRMEAAKEVLAGVIQSLPDSGANVALRVYGTAPKADKNCKDSKLLVPRGPVNKQALKAAVESVKLNGYTPIAYNLEQAAADLPAGGNNAIVLVTDGIESCGGDPCAVAARLAAQGITSRSFVVGFGIGADKGRFLECIGKYYPAGNQAELQKALGEIVTESLKPVTGTVTVYGAGTREKVAAKGSISDRLVVSAGTYDVVINAGGKETTWPSLPLSGDVVAPLGDAPPANLRSAAAPSPETSPVPTQEPPVPATQPATPTPANTGTAAPVEPTPPPVPPVGASQEATKTGWFGCNLTMRRN